ncbi:MAG: hypothetical protein ACD_73C00256G0008 [uncultured bacterium]|nr:MAG: hypothetical protein ACD_73C00256G0008 [uncultured bacterium]
MSDPFKILSLSNDHELVNKFIADVAKSYIDGLTEENNASIKTQWRKINNSSIEVVKNYFKSILSTQNDFHFFELFIVTQNDEYVGYHFIGNKQCLGEDPEWIGFINGLFIRKEFRRLGLAQKLFELGQKWFSDNNIHYIELNVNLGNQAGIAFWKKNGFDAVEQIMGRREPLKD